MREFGVEGRVPEEFVIASTDQETASMLGSSLTRICAIGGDLSHALGSRGRSCKTGDPCTLCDVDAIEVEATYRDGTLRTYFAVSTVCIGGWNEGIDYVTSTGFESGRELCPRAHPGDAMLDLLSIASGLGWRTKRAITRRMMLGTHLPHPAISTSRDTSFFFTGPKRLVVDGVPRGVAESVTCRVLAGVVPMVVPHG